MLVLGDVFAVVASLAGVFLTAYATILGLSLAFPNQVAAVRSHLDGGFLKPFLLGVVLGAPALLAAIILSGSPAPFLKGIGILAFMLILGVALIGMGGLANLLSERIAVFDVQMSRFSSLSRATFLLVGATLFPLVGWLLVAPVCLVIGFGCGIRAFFRPAPDVVIA